MTILLICLAGTLGVLLRYGVGAFAGEHPPWAIFAINVLGSFAAGVLYAWQDRLPPQFRIALMVGLLGGFTTFSSYSLHTFIFMQKGQVASALVYFGLTPIFSLAATYLGAKLAG